QGFLAGCSPGAQGRYALQVVASKVPFRFPDNRLPVESSQFMLERIPVPGKVAAGEVPPGNGPLDSPALFSDLFRTDARFEQAQMGGHFLEVGLLLGQATYQIGDFQRSDDRSRGNDISLIHLDHLQETGDRGTYLGTHDGAQLECAADPVIDLDQAQSCGGSSQNEQPADGSLVSRAEHVHGVSW